MAIISRKSSPCVAGKSVAAVNTTGPRPTKASGPRMAQSRRLLQVVALLIAGILAVHLLITTRWLERISKSFPVGPYQPVPGHPLRQYAPPSHHAKGNSSHPLSPLWVTRRAQVVAAFRHAWQGYSRDAFGSDEYKPLTHTGTNLTAQGKGIGYTIVDCLDTMLLMGLTEEYQEARTWVAQRLNFDIPGEAVSAFEITIRVLGGLLSAYHLSNNDALYLTKAVDLADRLMTAYAPESKGRNANQASSHNYNSLGDSRSYPTEQVYLGRSPVGTSKYKSEAATMISWQDVPVSLAEVGSVQLEMAYLSHLTHNATYHRRAQQIMASLRQVPARDGLLPILINPTTNQAYSPEIRLGSRGDSYYEYLLKQWVQTRGHRDQHVHRELYDAAVEGIKRHLVRVTPQAHLAMVGEMPYGATDPRLSKADPSGSHQRPTGTQSADYYAKMDHLVCFLPGLLALGATRGYSLAELTTAQHSGQLTMTARDQEDLDLAEKLICGCWHMYNFTATGLAPEIIHYTIDREATSPYTATTASAQPRVQWPAVSARNLGAIDVQAPSALNRPAATAVAEDFNIRTLNRHNLLRPETVESLFVLWRITKRPQYREWGWAIFEAFERHTRVATGGYTSINDVTKVPPPPRDKMETFFLSETLKYLYLLFGPDDTISLRDYVLNTEAHPLPILNQPRFSDPQR
ncbi:mannosyl-oligosaccharide alpha-1,2-mannosidase [Dimargaris xerosporica]|nr:mannosyl-oligosaccharide alpha-1,2-mannosidase [Dimargaris xerosporica]